MKKLLLAGAIALTAVVSQAAAVTWNVNNVQSSPDTAVAAGWLVELYAASVAYDFEDAKSGAITALDSATTVLSGTIYKASSTFGNFSANDDVSAYAVIYDAADIASAKNYVVSAVNAKSINAAGSDLTLAFGNMASTATSNMFRSATWTAAPEPTSGLLLLLGVAGLALRRRRA